ncbi:hypothetical protein N3391_003245 [Salmonella enterica subsp. enterica serovar Montevideo]|nr:hypothetical protein [Salmonella enterica subsp. enterica serovar Montevideo]EJT8386363.1 hypothetical protein [Salmonella enterica subsp. enterica serovar Montevideo]
MSVREARQREQLEAAFQWCCRRRKASPPDADIWHLWFHWQEIKNDLLAEITESRYRLSAMQIVGRGKDKQAVWSAQDAVVLKWVAMRLHDLLPVHPLCEHHKGHGGGGRSVHRMARSLQTAQWKYVCRTDIQGFYGHIRRGPLMRQLKRHVSDPVLLNLVRQYLHYSVERGGEFYTPQKGICRGCALSPLLAGFCLWAMDTYFEAQQPHLRYVRFMDDIVIFTRTRWHLRRAVRALNVFFASGGYRQHPDKTFIGKTEKGFDWMGIQFNRSGIGGVAPRAVANHRQRLRRLYERTWRYGKEKTRARVGEYMRRWKIWRTYMTTVGITGDRLVPKEPSLRQTHRGEAGPAADWQNKHRRSRGTRNLIEIICWRTNYMARLIVFAAVLLIALLPPGWAASTPSCAGPTWNSGAGGSVWANPTIPWPAAGLMPGTPAGYVRASGFTQQLTCTMPDGFDHVIYFNGVRGSQNDTVRVSPGVFDNYSATGPMAVRVVTGNAVVTCNGADGTRSATYPGDAVAAFIGSYISVPCRNRGDGTVRISVTIEPATLQVPSTGVFQFGSGSTYGASNGTSPRCWRYIACIGIAGPSVNPVTAIQDTNLTRTIRNHWQWPNSNTWGSWSCEANIDNNGRIDWGVLPAPSEPVVGGELGQDVTITATVTCPKTGSSPDWSITGGMYQIRGGQAGPDLHWLSTDNPSIAFRFNDQRTGSLAEVGTATDLASADITTTEGGQTLVLTKRLTVTPVIARVPISFGRTSGYATIDLWMRNR